MKRKIVFIFTLLIFLSSETFARQNKRSEGDNDLSLMEIDRLIRQTEYDEALKQLNNYILQHPQKFDSAQSRINKIMNIRAQYSQLAEKLIDMIITDPENSKEIYEIIAQLETFEKHPSAKNLQFISDLKKSTEFSYFRSLLQDIEKESVDFTQQEKYVEAVKRVREGFWLYKDSYYEQWASNPKVISDTDAVLGTINQQLDAYENVEFQNKIGQLVNEYVSAMKEDRFDSAYTAFINIKRVFSELRDIHTNIAGAEKTLQEIYSELQKIDEDTTDASFIPFMIRMLSGAENIPMSGIKGAFENQWKKYFSEMNQVTFAAVKRRYLEFVDVLNVNIETGVQWNSDSLYQTIAQYIGVQKELAILFFLKNEDNGFETENPFMNQFNSSDYFSRLTEAVIKLTKFYENMIQLENRQKVMIGRLNRENSLTYKQLTDLFQLSEDAVTRNLATSFVLEPTDDWPELNKMYDLYSQKIAEVSDRMLTDSWKNVSSYYVAASDLKVADIQSKLPFVEQYRSGFEQKLSDSRLKSIRSDFSIAFVPEEQKTEKNAELMEGEDFLEDEIFVLYRYPDIAIILADETQSLVEKNITELKEYLNIVRSCDERQSDWKQYPLIYSVSENLQNYLQRQIDVLNGQKVSLQKITMEAQKQRSAYQLAKNEAELRYAEAEASFRRLDFDNARKRLQLALTKYDEALNNQNDEKLRADCDEKMQDLGERITKAENEKVVMDVRNLKTRAKDAFFSGKFDDAKKLLNQAKIRWAVTNVEDDPEIINLETYVNNALTMNNGREILPSSPLYIEMTQLLNISHQYYDEGNALYKQGNKTEGNQSFDLAMENIQKLQLVYPLNQDAALLSLQINQMKNPQKFKEEFAQKVEAAKLLCQNKNTRQEGYSNLLDYYKIDPNYKGLKQLIYQTEIDIGIRIRPVDNSGEKKIKDMISQAQKMFNAAGDNTDKLNAALAKVNEVLELDYNNTTATSLKDKITIKIGGNNSLVLSTEDKRYYDLALQSLRANKAAYAKLYADKIGNKNSKDVKDLKNKINAAL